MMKILILWTSFMMTMIKHPMTISILLITIILLSLSYIFSMNLILISLMIIMLFIGGLMIMFVYFSSLLPNKLNKMNLSFYSILWLMMLIFSMYEFKSMNFNSSNSIIYFSSWSNIILIALSIIIMMSIIMNMMTSKKISMKTM